MPRLKSVDDNSIEAANRRASGRARKPTAKYEALAGTKFNPSDAIHGRRSSYNSQSPIPGVDSTSVTSASPASDQVDTQPGNDTSPSTISVDLNPELKGPAEDEASPAGSTKRGLRRDRKPTWRAMEATEVKSTRRQRRDTQGSDDFSESKSIITAPEESPTPNGLAMPIDPPAGATRIHENVAGPDKSSYPDGMHEVDAHNTDLARPTRGKKVFEAVPKAPENSPSRVHRRKRALMTDERSDLLEESTVESPEKADSVKPRRRNRAKTSLDIQPDREMNIPGELPLIPTKIKLSHRKAERIDNQDGSFQSPDMTSPSTKRPSRRAKSQPQIMSAQSPEIEVAENTTRKERPRRSAAKIYKEAPPTDDDLYATDDDHLTTKSSIPMIKLKKPAMKAQVATDSEPPTSELEPSPSEPPKKSLKLTLKAPGLKGPRLPSKLRFSISAKDQQDDSQVQPVVESTDVADVPKPTSKKDQQKVKALEMKKPVIEREVLQPAAPSATTSNQKQSRRAQAKAEAKAFSKIRQAVVPPNRALHESPADAGAASHYVPSARLLTPSMSCSLFCLGPSARILAFAQIAAESNESDDEESTASGQSPRLYEKWLNRGRERFCRCNQPALDQTHDAGSQGILEEAVPEQSDAVEVERPLNLDLEAAVPRDTVLPLSMPPVNSIMPKSEARRVSAMYHVLASNTSPLQPMHPKSVGTVHGHDVSPLPVATGQTRSTSRRRDQGDSASAAGTRDTPPIAGPFEERIRWDHQMLERIRREARDAGQPVTFDMTYTQIKSLLDAKKGNTSLQSTTTSGQTTPLAGHGHSVFSAGVYHPMPVSTGSSPAPSEALPNGRIPAPSEEPNSEKELDEAPQPGPTADHAHGYRSLRGPIPDEGDDRLMQIIGDSFKATMMKRTANSVQGRPSTSDGAINGGEKNGKKSSSRRSSTNTKRKAPMSPFEGEKKRRKVSGGTKQQSDSRSAVMVD